MTSAQAVAGSRPAGDTAAELTAHRKFTLADPAGFLTALYGSDAPGFLNVWTTPDKRSRWFAANDIERIGATITNLAGKHDTYFGLGLQPESLGERRRGEAATVSAIPCLWADIDVQDAAAHASDALPDSKGTALDFLRTLPLQPTLIVDSGHGLYPLWLFHELWIFDDDDERRHAQTLARRWERFIQAQAKRRGWKLDSTSDLARVLRPVGSINGKATPLPVRVLVCDDDKRYSPEDFERYLPDAEPRDERAAPVNGRIPDGKRNATLTSIAGTMRERGMDADEIEAMLVTINERRCDPPLDAEEVRGIALSIARYEAGELNRATITFGDKRGRVEPAVLAVMNISDVESEPVTWLWRGYIPLGKLTMLDGDPGLGKSTLTLDVAARATRGRLMPDSMAGDLRHAADVVLLTAEDGLADTTRPRLEAAGADLSRVHAIVGRTTPDGYADIVTLPDDVAAVEALVTEHGARLVIIDPLMAYLGGQTNSFRDQDVRRALAPVAAMADRTGAAVLVVRHLNKSSSSNALYRGGGSIGIIGAARSGLLVAPDPDDAERRILVVTKSNLAAKAPAMAFRIEPLGDVARVEWDGTTEHNASDLLEAPHRESNGLSPAVAEAVRFLRDVLYDGSVPTKQVNREAAQLGISVASLRRARKHLGIEPRRVGGVGDAGEWRLGMPAGMPDDDDEPPTEPKVLNIPENEHLREPTPESPHENQETAKALTLNALDGVERLKLCQRCHERPVPAGQVTPMCRECIALVFGAGVPA